MKVLSTNIGSARDNAKSPIHNWYKFTAGFSFRFVDEIINSYESLPRSKARIFDPFAGCGTTLVSCQKAQIPAVGNEGQKFMYDVIRAKLNWLVQEDDFESYLDFLEDAVEKNVSSFDYEHSPHSLLKGLYERDALSTLYLIRNAVGMIPNKGCRLFFNLALSQTLHKLSIYPIVPYISRGQKRHNPTPAWTVFEQIARQMIGDLKSYRNSKRTSKVYLHDSRKVNKKVSDKSCSICITSPPYLNNLDYGEVSKVHTHFFGYTSDWADITKKVRVNLVTGSTTHYRESDFDLDEFRQSDFCRNNKVISERLIRISRELRCISQQRAGRKSFDILLLAYFSDMFRVLTEMRRVIRRHGKAYLLLGDSAPYGVYVPTAKLLGQIAKSAGFHSYRTYRIGTRGGKWKLKYRHSLALAENVLVLK
jgi:DNA modification methylase